MSGGLHEEAQVEPEGPRVPLDVEVGEVRELGHADLGERDPRGQLLRREVEPLVQFDLVLGDVEPDAERHRVVELVGERRLEHRRLQRGLVGREAALEGGRPLGREPVGGEHAEAESPPSGRWASRVDARNGDPVRRHVAESLAREGVEASARPDHDAAERHHARAVERERRGIEEARRPVVAGRRDAGAARPIMHVPCSNTPKPCAAAVPAIATNSREGQHARPPRFVAWVSSE